jgi:Fe-S cluster assembly protein SufD
MAKPANLPSAGSSVEKPDVQEQLLHDFEVSREVTTWPQNEYLQELQEQAIEQFKRLGIPSTKDEYYKYTAVDRQLRTGYHQHFTPVEVQVSSKELADARIPGLDAHLIVLVNGRFNEDLSSVEDAADEILIENLADAAENYPKLFNRHFGRYADSTRESFIALNTAFARDGLFVYVPNGTVAKKPIHVLHLVRSEEPRLLQPRNLIVVGQSSEIDLIESFQTLDDTRSFTNGVTEIAVDENAHVDHYTLQLEGTGGSQVYTTQVHQQDNSTFSTNTFTLDGAFTRNNLNIVVDGQNCETNLYGLCLGKGSQHVDNHTIVDHAQPHCHSNELYRSILDDASSGVFNGRVLVREDSQKIDAFQSNKTILLTDEASIDTKPELEIYADDVECSHGATIGQLDEEALFYLRSRGVPERRAKVLLLYAFASDVVDEIDIEPLHSFVDKLVSARLSDVVN